MQMQMQQVGVPPHMPAQMPSSAGGGSGGGPLRFASGPQDPPTIVGPSGYSTGRAGRMESGFPLTPPGPVYQTGRSPTDPTLRAVNVAMSADGLVPQAATSTGGAERQLHTFSIQLTGASGIPAVPATKRTATGKPSAIGSSARGRYVRYMFCGETEAVLSRAETTTSHAPVFQSGGQHHLVLRSLEEVSKSDEFCIKTRNFVSKTRNFCIQNDEFCSFTNA